MRYYSIRSLLDIPGYKIKEIIKKDKKELHIRIEPYKRNKGLCSGCGVHHESYHSIHEMTAEDMRLSQRRVFLYIPKRRYKCPEDGIIHTEIIDWIDLGSRVTKSFAREINRLTSITTNQEAGWYLGLNDEKVGRIDKAILKEKAERLLSPPPTGIHISIDEVSYRKYHRYLTNVVDTEKKLIIWNAKGRKKEVLNRYYEAIDGDNCKKIESVALDGARTYISSTKKYAVNALIVLDKFHIIQNLNNTVERVRKDELQKARKNEHEELIQLTNCKQRFILLKKKSRLSPKQSATLKRLCEVNEPIYKAVLLKESFSAIYKCSNEDEAKEHLYSWLEQAFESGINVFEELAEKIIRKAQYIFNWFKKKISSAISEGFNNKIKRLKRMAYGYKDIEYFRLKIHQHCGLLNPRLST